jgi:mannosyltransferase
LTRAGALAAQPRGPGDIRMRDLVPERRPFMRLIRLALPSFVMFIVGLWRISGPSFWRDEAATMSAIRRPLPVLWQMLGKTDVVHGAYYLLMWPLVRVLGTSELGARLPSVVAVAAAAGGVAAIGRRLASERAGLAAGLAFALFPVASRYGQEVRSYALVMALAVLASYLLVRATDMDTSSRSWWLAYSATLAAMGWMNLMSLLIVPAHAITLVYRARMSASSAPAGDRLVSSPEPALGRLQRARRRLTAQGSRQSLGLAWLAAVATMAIVVSPLIVLAWSQRHGTARFLAVTSLSTVANVPGRLTGSWPVLVAILPIAIAGFKVSRMRSGIAWLCLPWLLVPPILLLAAGAFTPLYDPRYILFSGPALALLIGYWLDILVKRAKGMSQLSQVSKVASNISRFAARCHITITPGTVAVFSGVAVIGIISLPSQLAYRAPSAHDDNIRLAAHIVAGHERPGDAVLYQPPWWRQIAAAYPYGFSSLRDISLATSPSQADDFTGTQLPVSEIRKRLAAVRRVWLVEFQTFRPDPSLTGGWRAIARWRASTLLLVLYERRPSIHRPAP